MASLVLVAGTAIAAIMAKAAPAVPSPAALDAHGSVESALEARNIALIREHHDTINRGDVVTAAAFYAPTLTNNGNSIDRARVQASMADNARGFPDWNMRVDRVIARGDEVVALMTVSGTHKGTSSRPVNGGTYFNIPPTGRRFSVLHTHWFKLKDGLIVDHRATRDDLGLARQLGLLPAAPARPPVQPIRR